MEFSYELIEREGHNLLRLKGNLLDQGSALVLLDKVKEYINEGKNTFIIDMQEFGHMNSTGLNILISILTKSRKAGGETIICCISEKVKSLLIITKLNNVFTVAENPGEALKMISTGA